MAHKQPYLDSFQKRSYLLQNLKGEPLKAVKGYDNSCEGYILSLKRLKYMFGNRSLVAQATIRKLTSEKQIADHNTKGLANFYYVVSHCANTLKKMCYDADIYSTDVLRLSTALLRKWSEYSFKLRKVEEPSLFHLERWLQDRIMAMKDPLSPSANRETRK